MNEQRLAEHSRPCVLCTGTQFRFLVTGYDRMQARDQDYDYVRCIACGLVGRRELPMPEELPDLYPSDYTARIETGRRNLDKTANRLAIRYLYGVDRISLSRLPRAVLRVFSTRILNGLQEPHGANRLLDVGCGSGQSLEVYRALGWQASGIEVSPQACAACRERGVPVHEGTVFDAPFARGQFDVILLSHVIEHVLEPVAMLRRVAEFLAPNGKLVVTTPNVRGLGFSIYRACWFSLDAPRHLFLFDPQTIRRLAVSAGLRAVRVVTRSSPQVLRDSRHYASTQGYRLPPGVAHRRALLAESARRPKPPKAYRDLMSPLTYVASLFGRGDTLEADLRAR